MGDLFERVSESPRGSERPLEMILKDHKKKAGTHEVRSAKMARDDGFANFLANVTSGLQISQDEKDDNNGPRQSETLLLEKTSMSVFLGRRF